MRRKTNRRKRKKIVSLFLMAIFVGGIVVLGSALLKKGIWTGGEGTKNPEQILMAYMECISEKKYKDMYGMLTEGSAESISEKNFVERNSTIYEGIKMQNMVVRVTAYDKESLTVTYSTSFDTAAGKMSFENNAVFLKEKNGFRLKWDDSMIFPELDMSDKVRVTTIQAERGEILDRNGTVLAGEGTASNVGIIPGKLNNREKAIKEIARLLEIKPENIKKQLSQKWVKDDSFVPIKNIPKVRELDLLVINPDDKVLKEQERQKKLLDIAGVMISDTEVREYPLEEATAHLVGYVQNVTAEDLEEHAGEGYTSNSVIGKTGAEGLFEKELKGVNGCRIYIVDFQGKEKEELACIPVQNGKDVRLTIDARLQSWLYESFKKDKSCSVCINPFTGEVLALVSTPSYDNNAFVMGMSQGQWKKLNKDGRKPLYNRFRQIWCPGSTFKPITAAVGLQSGAVDPTEDFGSEGLSWQKDKSWGTYHVTTLHTYRPVVLQNALIYSDNIYFAKSALKIGVEEMEQALSGIGFHCEMPFEIKMGQSVYSNTEHIESEIQLADSGYGQGQILVNPLHMACIYTSFCNDGNMLKPYLIYKNNAKATYWVSGAFSKQTAKIVLDGIKKVVNDPRGTGYAAHRRDVILAGKTGTAEIKASKEDTSGTELGWFTVFTPSKREEKPILTVSMVEDVKDRGGSGYVIERMTPVLEKWFREDLEKMR